MKKDAKKVIIGISLVSLLILGIAFLSTRQGFIGVGGQEPTTVDFEFDGISGEATAVWGSFSSGSGQGICGSNDDGDYSVSNIINDGEELSILTSMSVTSGRGGCGNNGAEASFVTQRGKITTTCSGRCDVGSFLKASGGEWDNSCERITVENPTTQDFIDANLNEDFYKSNCISTKTSGTFMVEDGEKINVKVYSTGEDGSGQTSTLTINFEELTVEELEEIEEETEEETEDDEEEEVGVIGDIAGSVVTEDGINYFYAIPVIIFLLSIALIVWMMRKKPKRMAIVLLIVLIIGAVAYFGFSQSIANECGAFSGEGTIYYYANVNGDCLNSAGQPCDVEDKRFTSTDLKSVVSQMDNFYSNVRWNPKPNVEWAVCEVGGYTPSRCSNAWSRCTPIEMSKIEAIRSEIAENTRVDIFRLENNDCNQLSIRESEKTENDYSTLEMCESKIIPEETEEESEAEEEAEEEVNVIGDIAGSVVTEEGVNYFYVIPVITLLILIALIIWMRRKKPKRKKRK